MDISKLQDEAATDDTPIPVELKDRAGDLYLGKNGKPSVWYVVGEYSKQVKDFDRKQTAKIIKKARRGDDEFSADESEQAAIDKIVAASASPFWENVEDEKGASVPFNKDNAAVVLRRAPWLAPQLQRAIKGHADFFKRASAS